VKTINSPRPWPPEACDEIRQILFRYSWSQERLAVVDDLSAILDEHPGQQLPPGDDPINAEISGLPAEFGIQRGPDDDPSAPRAAGPSSAGKLG